MKRPRYNSQKALEKAVVDYCRREFEKIEGRAWNDPITEILWSPRDYRHERQAREIHDRLRLLVAEVQKFVAIEIGLRPRTRGRKVKMWPRTLADREDLLRAALGGRSKPTGIGFLVEFARSSVLTAPEFAADYTWPKIGTEGSGTGDLRWSEPARDGSSLPRWEIVDMGKDQKDRYLAIVSIALGNNYPRVRAAELGEWHKGLTVEDVLRREEAAIRVARSRAKDSTRPTRLH